jgi:hypothetical protein
MSYKSAVHRRRARGVLLGALVPASTAVLLIPAV